MQMKQRLFLPLLILSFFSLVSWKTDRYYTDICQNTAKSYAQTNTCMDSYCPMSCATNPFQERPSDSSCERHCSFPFIQIGLLEPNTQQVKYHKIAGGNNAMGLSIIWYKNFPFVCIQRRETTGHKLVYEHNRKQALLGVFII